MSSRRCYNIVQRRSLYFACLTLGYCQSPPRYPVCGTASLHAPSVLKEGSMVDGCKPSLSGPESATPLSSSKATTSQKAMLWSFLDPRPVHDALGLVEATVLHRVTYFGMLRTLKEVTETPPEQCAGIGDAIPTNCNLVRRVRQNKISECTYFVWRASWVLP
ncbi:hypothetical protein BKA70DRAFT_1316306 [Coprinopsis sp. MPI-PUGE-AT-0042]|nr:hypothetical protein BKA70DRAFT_1316306 [Coprinopsis sp. MPI-PUGE-AT-0042]